MPQQIQRFGWIPDLPDQRDHFYAAPVQALQDLPPQVDLRPSCPAVYDQGQLGSCTANAIGAGVEFEQLKQHLAETFTPSRLFIYYNERAMEGTVDTDSGAQIRDGMKSVAQQGACPETLWPYDIAKFARRPTAQCYKDAKLDRAVSYQRLAPDLNQMRGCIASGYPFIFGFTVYESFETVAVRKTGHAPMPRLGERAVGGHAVMAVGYDEARQWFTVRNSWGAGWGLKGYFTMPYAYLLQPGLSQDFWTIRLVGE